MLAQFEVEFAEAVSQMSAQCAARRSDLINKAQSEKNIAEDKAKSAIDDRRTHIATKEDNIKTFIIIGTFLVSFLVSLLALYDHWTHYQGHPIPRFTTTLFLAVALAVMIAILTIGGWLVGTIVSKICRSTWSSPESAAKPFAKEIKGIENSADNELRTVDRLQQEINTTKVMLERKT